MECAVVIHTEEEFDWDGGFNRHNNSISHHQELLTTVQNLLKVGAKVTLALDYAFIRSAQGKQVIESLVAMDSPDIEFASHLHPWVTPPYDECAEDGSVTVHNSFAGNLDKALEFEKLKTLTLAIESLTKVSPTTYLAGRYGIGNNTYTSLKQLGYTVDISPSAYCDFSRSGGPDFFTTTNQSYRENELSVFPHTSAFISAFPLVGNYFNNNPDAYRKFETVLPLRIIAKLLRVKKLRFSTEGVPFNDLKKIVTTLRKNGQKELIMSLHSSSLKEGLTPYSSGRNGSLTIGDDTCKIVDWMLNTQDIQPALVSNFSAVGHSNLEHVQLEKSQSGQPTHG
jgi:hypothetical protein